MRTIKEGDKVSIHWSYSDTPDVGIVRHTPSDVGDMWYIDIDGFTMAVNPCSSQLETIVKQPTPEEKQDADENNEAYRKSKL